MKILDACLAFALGLLLWPSACSAFDIVGDLGGWNAIQRDLVFMVIGFFGMLAHYAKRWLRREIDGSLIDYLVRDHPRDTLLSLAAYVTAAGSTVLSGGIEGLTFQQIIIMAGGMGFTVDSSVNRSTAVPPVVATVAIVSAEPNP